MQCDSALFPSLLAPDSKQVAIRRFPSAGIRKFGIPFDGGLAYGCLHEFYSVHPEDVAAAAGLVAGMTIAATDNARCVVWLRSRQSNKLCGAIQGAGWAELGGTPEACLFVLADDAIGLLRASIDVVRSGGVDVVVIESRGRMPELDLTASRRLSLAAEKSGALILLLRSDAEPVPSAAETRWSVASAPSRALPGNAPGMPAFDIELLRHRFCPAGDRWRLEWDRDRRIFRDAAASGAVVPVPSRRTAAVGGGEPTRHAA